MLSLALNALSASPRTAYYEADLVACWASMCNISYAYDKNDSVALALHKVITVLRKDGMPIYNFHANTVGGETDLQFMDYAAAMKQSNGTSGGLLFGSPIFTGRADTLKHIQFCLEQSDTPLPGLIPSFDVQLRKIGNSSITNLISCSEKEQVISAFTEIISGTVDGERTTDIVPLVQQLLNTFSVEELMLHSFVRASIAVEGNVTLEAFNAWAIIPSRISTSPLVISRESLNGTLVLSTPGQGTPGSSRSQILAYLNMTHQKEGTYLIKSDENGVVDIVFRSQVQPLLDPAWLEGLKGIPNMGGVSFLGLDMLETADDRAFDVQIQLGMENIPAT